jgi:hypothetical protein
MKKVVLLSGMIGLGLAANVNARIVEKAQLSIDEVNRKKLVDQKIREIRDRKPVYTMLDALIVKDAGTVIDAYTQPIAGYQFKNNIDWAAIFHILDSMQGVISVNEYMTPMTLTADDKPMGNYLLLDIAVETNNLSAAKILLEKYKANPNKGPYTPYQQALESKNAPMINLLMKHGGRL